MTGPEVAALPPVTIVSLPGVRLGYRESGGGARPVVLMHAYTGTSASWRAQFGPFAAAGYRVIAPDRRGWGASTPNAASGPQPGTAVEDLANLVDYLQLPPFHLVGVAAGGFVALDYAAWRPDTLRSLTVAASQGGIADAPVRQLIENVAVPGFEDLPHSFRELGPSFRALHPERVREWEAAQRDARDASVPSQPLRTPNTLAKIAAITLPTLVMSGSADLLAPPSLMRTWSAHLPNVEGVTVAEAGHSIPQEEPEQFNQLVLDFLSRIQDLRSESERGER